MVNIMKAPTAANPVKIREITLLVARQMAMEDELARLSQQVEDKTKELYKMKTVTIPLAMQAARVKSIVLEDGNKVEVEDFITANIKDEDRPKAFAWLRKNKLDAIIKRAIDLRFGMGEDKKAAAVAKWLDGKRIPFESKESIHAGTLRSFVRERLEAGKALPPSISYTTVSTANIKRSK